MLNVLEGVLLHCFASHLFVSKHLEQSKAKPDVAFVANSDDYVATFHSDVSVLSSVTTQNVRTFSWNVLTSYIKEKFNKEYELDYGCSAWNINITQPLNLHM